MSILTTVSGWLHNALTKILSVTTNPKVWVQWCHFSIAVGAVIFTYLLFLPVWLTCALGVPAAAYKEFWIDPHDENHTNGLPAPATGKVVGKPDYLDFTFYMLGMTAALLFLRYAHHR